MTKQFLDYLAEAIGDGPRIPHPEDSILQGSNKAMDYAQALEEIVQSPESGTIKWDGGIALYFGRNESGQFFMTDKYMPAKGVYPTSPQGWRDYDAGRGSNRADLYSKIETIWPGLEKSVGNTTGIFKGDLMAVSPDGLKPTGSGFVFSPTTVTYTVPTSSYLGKLMQNKVALIVVHEYDGKPWDGKQGLANVSNVAVISPNVDLNFSMPAVDASNLLKMVRDTESIISSFGKQSDAFVAGLDNVARGLLSKYLNHVRTQQTKDTINQWLRINANPKQFRNLIGDDEESGYIAKNKAGLDALYNIWNAMFKTKVAIVNAYEGQIQGFKQTTAAGPGGEGIVFPTSHGLIKLINPNFGIAHFSKEH
jgi:hypothetical protein